MVVNILLNIDDLLKGIITKKRKIYKHFIFRDLINNEKKKSNFTIQINKFIKEIYMYLYENSLFDNIK